MCCDVNFFFLEKISSMLLCLARGKINKHTRKYACLFDKNVGWVYRSLEFENAILREGDPVTVGAGIILR